MRRQVLEYILYTYRTPITQEFVPTDEEQTLYDMVSEYLRRASLQALPLSQRTLKTLNMRKLLASSTFAIGGALDLLARKLERHIKDDHLLRENLDAEVEEEISTDYDGFDETSEEWVDDEGTPKLLTGENIVTIEEEIVELRAFCDLAVSIAENAKGLSLLRALRGNFSITPCTPFGIGVMSGRDQRSRAVGVAHVRPAIHQAPEWPAAGPVPGGCAMASPYGCGESSKKGSLHGVIEKLRCAQVLRKRPNSERRKNLCRWNRLSGRPAFCWRTICL